MKLNTKWMGWIVAAGSIGFMMLSGFQPAQEKTGVVDLNRVLNESDRGRKANQDLQNALAVREDLLNFVNTYRILTLDQAAKLRELSLKPTPTEADKAEIEKIKKEVIDSDKRRNEILQKTNQTEAEQMALRDFADRARTVAERILPRWDQEMQGEMSQLETKLRQETLEAARLALRDTAKTQGFTVVIESTVAPYGANDLTEPTIKTMNAKR